MKFDSIDSAVKELKKRGMVVVLDNEDRENEGDLVMASDAVTSSSINFMAKEGRGLICISVSNSRAKKLDLKPMEQKNTSLYETAFTVSVDAVKGTTTGISAPDRCKTIKTIVSDKANPSDLARPGHIFPIIGRNGGVLRRAGHTEASVDISKLSNLNPSSVICEVMNEDGRMARLKDLYRFSKKHKIKLASIEDLISYRLKYEKLVIKLNSKLVYLNRNHKLNIHYFRNKLENNINFVITKGSLNKKKSIPVRVISTSVNKRNILRDVKVNRSIKILSKFKSYLLLIINKQKKVSQDSNINTLRYYGIGAQIIKDLNVKNMILLSRSRKKIIGLDGFGLKIKKQIIIK